METGRQNPSPAGSLPQASCPTSEALAAFVDRGVGAAEWAQIEAHLADCDECRLLIAHALETTMLPATCRRARATCLQSHGPRDGGCGGPWGRSSRRLRRCWSIAQVNPRWVPGGSGGGVDARLADLADAVGQERTVEARLTGGFRYGPLRASVRSGGSLAPLDNWKLFAAAGRIREDVTQDPTSDNLHALGLAHLVIGNLDEAVQAFEDAIAEDASKAQYQSDLAAAYSRAPKQLDRPDDLPRALAAAERAAADNGLAEAKFNRALALQSLFLEEAAARAWQDYLALDSSSMWADEARRYLAKLQTSASGPTDPARNNSPPPITETTVEAGLDWVLRQGLPAWADAVIAGNTARATSEQSSLLQYTNQIGDAANNPLPRALGMLPAPGDPAAPAIAASLRGVRPRPDTPRGRRAFRWRSARCDPPVSRRRALSQTSVKWSSGPSTCCTVRTPPPRSTPKRCAAV